MSAYASAAGRLLAKQPEHKANFSRAQGAVSESKLKRQTRFPTNPEPNWGPKPRHKRVKVGILPTGSVCPIPTALPPRVLE